MEKLAKYLYKQKEYLKLSEIIENFIDTQLLKKNNLQFSNQSKENLDFLMNLYIYGFLSNYNLNRFDKAFYYIKNLTKFNEND